MPFIGNHLHPSGCSDDSVKIESILKFVENARRKWIDRLKLWVRCLWWNQRTRDRGIYCGWCGTNERIESDQNSFLPIAFSAVNEMQFHWNQFHFIANRTELIPGKCQFPSRRASIPIDAIHSTHRLPFGAHIHPPLCNIKHSQCVRCFHLCIFESTISMLLCLCSIPLMRTLLRLRRDQKYVPKFSSSSTCRHGSVVWTNSCFFFIR